MCCPSSLADFCKGLAVLCSGVHEGVPAAVLRWSAYLQDAEGKQREKAERLRFGRFFYRFPNGESGCATVPCWSRFSSLHASSGTQPYPFA